MRIALSGRLWESVQDDQTPLAKQFANAAAWGYQGFEIRKSHMPLRRDWDATREHLQKNNLKMVSSPVAGPPTDEESTKDFQNSIDFIAHLNGEFARLIPRDANYNALRRAADLAGEKNVKLISQLHVDTLTDTVARCEEFFATLNHPNFGLIFDACHLPFSESTSIDEAAKRLAPWTDVLNLQTYKLAKAGSARGAQTIDGKDWEMTLPDDADGTDLAESIRAVHANGFDGWMLVMPAVDPADNLESVAKAYKTFLTPLV
ncbi:MAG: sugar phosphate isomerase/epimerase [Abditibacteriaceae bacterium]